MVGKDPGFPSEPDFEDGEPPQFKPPVVETQHQKKFEPKPLMQFQGRSIITNKGRIAYLMLPNKFELREERENEFCVSYEYMIPKYESMKIGHWDWSNPNSILDENVRANFAGVLNQEPHVLSQEELEFIEDVIPPEVYGHNGNFEVTSLKTDLYGGKVVLVMENKWWDEDRKAYGLFFPTDDSFQFLESLHFEGTEWDFRKTFLSAKAAFIRIKWRV